MNEWITVYAEDEVTSQPICAAFTSHGFKIQWSVITSYWSIFHSHAAAIAITSAKEVMCMLNRLEWDMWVLNELVPLQTVV